jgi:hypothetical protein
VIKVIVVFKHPSIAHGGGHDRWIEHIPNTESVYHTDIIPQQGEFLEWIDGKTWRVHSVLHNIKDSNMSGVSLRNIRIVVE